MGQQCSNTVQQVQEVIDHHINQPSAEQVKIQIDLMRNKNQDLRNVAKKYLSEQKQEFFGYIKDGLKQGYGELRTSQQKRFYGYFKDNLPHIRGILIFSNDHYYMGQFENGKMHGNGKQVSPYFTFEGQYHNDNKKNGKLWTQQFTYQGSFQQQDNKFGGYGQLSYQNGQKYIGYFKQGQFQGQGLYYGPDNKLLYEGEFKHNLYHGFGKYYWQDGSYFEGQYVHGQKNGEGKYFKQGNQTIYGIWEQGSITARSKDKSMHSVTKNSSQANRSNHSTKMEEVF